MDALAVDAFAFLVGVLEADNGLARILAIDLGRIPQGIVNGVVVGSILALAAVGLTMVYGILRIANFAHGDLLTLGTYLALYFFALITLPATIAWGIGFALLLLAVVGIDRLMTPASHGGTTGTWRHGARALSDQERITLAYLALVLLLLVAGVHVSVPLSPGGASLLLAALIALVAVYRVVQAEQRDPKRSGLWFALALLIVVAAHLLVPLQTGPGGFTWSAELALGLIVLALGSIRALPAPGRDPWMMGALGAAGLLAAFLFASTILLAVALALAGVAAFTVVLERLVWRRARGQKAGLLTLIIISIGIMLALRSAIIILWDTRQRAFPDTLRRGEPILGSDVLITPHQSLAVGVTLVVILFLHLFLRHSKVGKAMRALADDLELARVSGINVDRVVLYVWIITGALAALAGVLYGMVRPFDPNLGWYQLLPIFAAVILGGIGSAYGALLGAYTIGIAMEVSPFLGVPVDYKLAVGFGILILVMIFRPRGILGVQATH